MKNKIWLLSLIAVCTFALIITTPVLAQTPTPLSNGTPTRGDKVVIANTYRLQNGESLTGDLVAIGSTATVETGATVTGDVVLVGGTITINGTVNGNLVAVGGAASLGDGAVINGDIVTVGASLNKSSTAKVTGTITEQTPSVNVGNSWKFPWNSSQSLLTRLLTAAFESLAIAALAVVIGLILPKQTQEVSNAIQSEPLVAGGVGLLVVIGSPILLIILIITIILIPVGVLFVLAFGLALVFGLIALGNTIGEQFAKLMHATWAVPVTAGIGSLVVTLAIGMTNLLPCVGWIVGFFLSLLGLGAVIMTRFGSISASPKPTTPIVPPASPVTTEPPQIPPAN
jgi:cytoskeletal protein CcmA (bactofilin family)